MAENEGMENQEGSENEGGEENQNGSFFEGLSEENRNDPSAEKFKAADNDQMFNNYKELQSLSGKKGVVLPKEGDAEDLARFNTEIGGISDATKFDLPAIDDAESIQYSQDAWKELSANLGLRPEQALKGQELIAENSRQIISQMQTKTDEAFGVADQKVRAEMGADYDLNMSKVDKLIMNNAGSEEGAKRLFDAVKKDPEAFQALSKIAGQLSETSLGKIDPIASGLSSSQAKARQQEIMADPAYGGDNDEANEMLINEMENLDKVIMKAKG